VSLPLAATESLGGGLSRYYFAVSPGTTITRINLTVNAHFAVSDTVAIDQVQTADALPFIGTARQQILSLVPGGSVRNQGFLALESATSNLGHPLVYTYPAGFGWTPLLDEQHFEPLASLTPDVLQRALLDYATLAAPSSPHLPDA
jgi:hypothetical protein